MIFNKSIFLFASILFSFFMVVSQDSKQQVTTEYRNDLINFPGSFVGNWKGEMVWSKPGKNIPETFVMELRIQPSKDSAGQFTWNIIYGSENKDAFQRLIKILKAYPLLDVLREDEQESKPKKLKQNTMHHK